MISNTIDQIVKIYEIIKEIVLQDGHGNEIEWCKNIYLNALSEENFYREYSWVVINSGMKYQVAKRIYDAFWKDNTVNFDAVRHPNKNKALRQVYSRLDQIFYFLKSSYNPLKYLETLPQIGPVTKYHLARNIGIDCAKPDRHLVRIASFFGYEDVQKFCQEIADKTGDRIGVVDIVWWRFAESYPNYLDQITYAKERRKNREEKER